MITQKIDMNVCNSFILSMIVREKMQAFATIFFNKKSDNFTNGEKKNWLCLFNYRKVYKLHNNSRNYIICLI
jgi:hypothetical protein